MKRTRVWTPRSLKTVVRHCLLPAADTVDEDEGPVILAWSVEALSDYLATNLWRAMAGKPPLTPEQHWEVQDR